MNLSELIWDTVHHAANIRADYEADNIDFATYHRRLADYSREQALAIGDYIQKAVQ